MKARSTAAVLVMSAAAGLALMACRAEKSADATETLAPVVIGPENITVVAETTLVDGPPISGSLGAEREARVRAELGGSVLQVYAEPGQPVKQGQVLAQIEPQTRTRAGGIHRRPRAQPAERPAAAAAEPRA